MGKTVWTGLSVVVLMVLAVIYFANSSKKLESEIQIDSSPIESSASQNFEASKASSNMTHKTYSSPPKTLSIAEVQGRKIRINTSRGDIVFELFEEAPLASSNFIFLANEKFYDGLTFHRREENFVIQGGDPNGNGTGGPGYKFNDEKVIRNYKRGIVAMANSGPNTNGSQFFIMLADNPLPKNYTIFGQVISGMDVVDKIQVGDVMPEVTVE